MFRIILFSILMVFSVFALADTYQARYEFYYGSMSSSTRFPTRDAACSYAKDAYSGASYTLQTVSPYTCSIKNSSGTVITSGTMSSIEYCDYGGNQTMVDGVVMCTNAPACLTGETRDAITGECKPSARVCSSTEYDNGTACAPIPDCNADQPLGRYFFDMTTKACATTNTVGTICINENQKYCPPIDDCKDPGYICTNQPAAIEAAAATRQAEIDAAKAKADAVKAEIAAAAAAAAQAAASKETAAAKAKADKEAAAAAVAAANASGVQSAIDAAIKAYSQFATDYIDSLARAANSSAASQKAADIDGQAGTEVAAIPASNPGNANGHKDNVTGLLPGSTQALDDAVTGNGNGNGAGSGVGTKDSPSIDTSKLNKEETQKSIDTSLKGIKDALGAPSTGESDTTLADVDKGVRDAMQGVIDDVNGVDTSLGTNPAAAVGMTSSYWSYAQGTCFPHEFDMGRFGSVKLDKFCSIYDEHVRPLLVLVLGFFGVLHVWSYWASIIAMTI
jgi:hypothetical protein